MSSWFTNWFKHKAPTTPAPIHEATLAIWAKDAETGAPIPNAAIDFFEPDFPAPEDGRTNQDGYYARQVKVGSHLVEVHADGYGSEMKAIEVTGNHDEPFALTAKQVEAPVTPARPVRSGMVTVTGRTWRDAAGEFYPLGDTLFWAVAGWRHERERFQQNARYVASKGHDYVRILGDVGWADVDSSAADYETILGEVIDWLYDVCGLRVEITVWGGSDRDPINAAQRVAKVIADGRQHKVLDSESSNESGQNGPDDPTLDKMSVILRAAGCVVAPSSPMGSVDFEAWLRARIGDRWASIGCVHLDRTFGDLGWRAVRQPWDWKGLPYAITHNEPIGPRSSVAEMTDPLRLVMLRVFGIMCGLGAFVLHNGAGVAGQVDPAHNRPANLWEVPGIDAIMQAIRQIDAILPNGLADWAKSFQHGGYAFPGFEMFFDPPLIADGIWSDGHDHGCSRIYNSTSGNDLFTVVLGVKPYVNLKATRALQLTIYNPVTLEKQDRTVVANEVFRLEGDEGANAAYIIRGRQ